MLSKAYINKCYFSADYKEICQHLPIYCSIGQKYTVLIII